MERINAGEKEKRSTNGLNYYNQNTVIIIIICQYGKRWKKYNEIHMLSIAEPLCPSRCLFRTILVTQRLLVWDCRISRAEPMLYCWHDLLFFLSPLFYLFLTYTVWLYGVGVFGMIVFSLSPCLTQLTTINNNNNNTEQNGFEQSTNEKSSTLPR